MSDSRVDCGHSGIRTGGPNNQAALESLLDAFCRNAYSNIRRSRKLLQTLNEVMFDPGRAPERRKEIEQLCDEAEAWIRERYTQQVADTIAAKRLAHLEEREQVRLKNLLSAVVLARQAARGTGRHEFESADIGSAR